MEPDFHIALANYGERNLLLNKLIDKVRNGVELNLSDGHCLLELVLLLRGRNEKLPGTVIEILETMLHPNSCHYLCIVIPHLMDFMGHASNDTSNTLQKLMTGFLKLSNQPQKLKIIKDGLEHPLWKVKVATMKIMASLEKIESCILKDQVKRLLNESEEEQVLKYAKETFKKLGMVINQPPSPDFSSKEIEAAEKRFEQSLKVEVDGYHHSKGRLNFQLVNSIKSNLASVPNPAEGQNVNLKIEALVALRSSIGMEKFGTFAKLIRESLKNHHPEILKEAMVTVTYLLLNKLLRKETEDYIQVIVKCLESLSESVSACAYIALKHLIKAFPTDTILFNILFNANSKSSTIRRKVAKLLSETLGCFGKYALNSCFLGLEQAMEDGTRDEDIEVQTQWQKIFLKFPFLFERMTQRIFFTDEKIIKERQSEEDDHEILTDLKLSQIELLPSRHSSIVINATFLGKKVTIRKIRNCDERRIENERRFLAFTNKCRGFTPLLHELEFPDMTGFVMPKFDTNLNDAVKANILGEAEKLQVINDILKALDYLHSHGYIHNGLEPNHILLHLFNDGFEVLLRNFGRAGLESEEPLCPPSNDWSAPEALAAPRNCSKMTDLYSLGLVSYFVWSSGSNHKGKNLASNAVESDLELRKPHLGRMFITLLTSNGGVRPATRLAGIFPVFWKHGSYRYYVERLREFFRRTNVQHLRTPMQWTDSKAISKELADDMAKFRTYGDDQVDLIMFLRNLSIHGRKSEAKMSVCGSDNELLEGWIEKNFETFLIDVFERTYTEHDEQLISELLSITI